MAILCIITSIMGLIYEITLSPVELSKINNAINKNNETPIGNGNKNQSFETIDGNYNNFSDQIRTNNSHLNFICTMIVVNMVLAVIIYSILAYYSYKAYKIFQFLFFEHERNLNQPVGSYNTIEQPGVRNRGNNVYGLSGSNARTEANPTQSGFVPFSGRGTIISDA